MIDLSHFKQKGLEIKSMRDTLKSFLSNPIEVTKSKEKIENIDLENVKEWGLKSADELKEYSGNWTTHVVNNELKLQLYNFIGGTDDSVAIPNTGWTWHTHPRGCPNIKKCAIIPPSANDLKIFAERHNDTHMVISKRRVYWIKAKREFSKESCEDIHKYYKLIEKFFDKSAIDHDEFDVIFTLASKLGNFFHIYKFKNKDVLLT